MGKIVTLTPRADAADWYGALVDDEGREIPITDAMVQRALTELDAAAAAGAVGDD